MTTTPTTDPRARHRRALRAASAVAVAGALLGACGGSKAADTQGVDALLGFDTAGVLQRERIVEERTAECMRARGFEYRPADPVARRTALVGGNLSEEEFTAQYGYGITTLLDRSVPATADPNVGIRNALGPADRAAYDVALLGEDRSATFFAAMDTGDFSRLGGCTRTAVEAAFGGAATVTSLQTKLDELDRRIVADPRMVAAVATWTRCMADAGYPGLTVSEDVDATLQARLIDVIGPLASFDPTAAPTYDKAALTELQRLEVAMVTADVACEDKHVAAVEDKVRSELEKAFRQDNAALVERARTGG